ncbi:MAG: class I SAM-dependent rRNA methyltransferase [Clostridia bacterium]|nr:class I SAM-dependent rRNA methyltransferase [Clostridia bacterium]
MQTVILKKNEEKRILAGHPWVYANEVQKIEGEGKNGDLCEVRASDGRFLGKGYINHLSKILVRVMIRREEESDGREFFEERIRAAKALRETLGYDDCYRAVFSEADGLPGLIVDKYHDLLCAQLLTLGMDKRKDLICGVLKDVFSPRGIYERSDTDARAKEGLKQVKGALWGDFEPRVTVRENGLLMRVDLENGQKTGYFLDQKENRLALRRYCKNAESVLDCFCNSGGFSLNAAAAGAKRVLAVDISEKALSDVRENAAQNGFTNIETLKGDVFEVLRRFGREGKTFDTVVLDPPAFCKSAAEARDAYRGYREINVSGMKLTRPGGFLATASCSHYMSAQNFEKMLLEAARDAGRQARVMEIKTQAPDHAAQMSEQETAYLKFYVLQVI